MNPLPGVFPVNFVHLSGHNARIAPFEINEIPSKIHRPGFNILCGMGSVSCAVASVWPIAFADACFRNFFCQYNIFGLRQVHLRLRTAVPHLRTVIPDADLL